MTILRLNRAATLRQGSMSTLNTDCETRLQRMQYRPALLGAPMRGVMTGDEWADRAGVAFVSAIRTAP
jgi:hypothetical protein